MFLNKLLTFPNEIISTSWFSSSSSFSKFRQFTPILFNFQLFNQLKLMGNHYNIYNRWPKCTWVTKQNDNDAAIPERKRKRFYSVLYQISLSLGVAGKLDNVRNQWSDITFAFTFALVWLDHNMLHWFTIPAVSNTRWSFGLVSNTSFFLHFFENVWSSISSSWLM